MEPCFFDLAWNRIIEMKFFNLMTYVS